MGPRWGGGGAWSGRIREGGRQGPTHREPSNTQGVAPTQGCLHHLEKSGQVKVAEGRQFCMMVKEMGEVLRVSHEERDMIEFFFKTSVPRTYLSIDESSLEP